MNRKKALINVATSFFLRVIILVVTMVVRRFLLLKLGSESIGLISLYTSIIGFLAIAELGIGVAITFNMYKPLVDNDYDKISALYYLYKKIYIIIAMVILVIGVIMVPFIPLFVKNNTRDFNIYLTFSLFLISTIITYLYAHKTSFINANLDNYKTNIIRSLGTILESLLQILLLISITYISNKSIFNLFFLIIIISNIIQWISTNLIFKKSYIQKINGNKILDVNIKNEVKDKTKAMFSHKIGGLLVTTTDSVIISSFVGISLLGIYTNYVTIASGIVGIITLVFSSITSIIGQSYASNSKEVFKKQFTYIYIINIMLGLVFFFGYYAVINFLIQLIFKSEENLILSQNMVIIITMNYFVIFMRNAVLSFRDASGTYNKDKYKPLIEGVLNLILSLILVNNFGISGVLVATLITNLLISHTIEPYIIYKYGFESSPKKYYYINYGIITIMFLMIIFYNYIPIKTYDNLLLNIILRGSISLSISLTVIFIIYLLSKQVRNFLNNSIKELFVLVRKKVTGFKRNK